MRSLPYIYRVHERERNNKNQCYPATTIKNELCYVNDHDSNDLSPNRY